MLHFACWTECFPVTLTLSLGELGEREQQASDWCLADGRWANSGAGVIERRWTFLPLPGELVITHKSYRWTLLPFGPNGMTAAWLSRRDKRQ